MGIVGKLGTAVAAVITVPILLGYLGVEGYGLWVTAATLVAWIGLGQLGIPQSLLNKIAHLDPSDDERSLLIGSAWWLSIGTAVALLALLLVLNSVGVWGPIFNVSSDAAATEAGIFLTAMWIAFAASLPLAIPASVLRADQQVHIVAFVEMSAALLRALAIVAVVHLDLGVAALAASAALVPLVVAGLLAVHVIRTRIRWSTLAAFAPAAARKLLRTGFGFVGIGVAALVISSADVLIIAQMFGPATVPTYSVAFGLLVLFLSLEVAILDALWPAYVEAAGKSDKHWIQTTHSSATVGLAAASTVFAIGLVVSGQELILLWAGQDAIPPASLLWVLGGIAIVQALVLTHSRLLIGLGRIKRTTQLSLLGAVVNLPASIALGLYFGVTGVAMGTLVAYLAVVVLNVRDTRAALREMSDRIPIVSTNDSRD